MKLKEIVKQRWAAYTTATCSAVILYMALSHIGVFFTWLGSLWVIFSPIVIGLVFAYLMNPIANYFEKSIFRKVKKEESRHTCSVILSVGCVLCIVTTFLVMIVPALTESITSIINNYDTYYKNVRGLIDNIYQIEESLAKVGIHLELPQISKYTDNLIQTIFDSLKNNLGSIMGKINDIGSSIFNIVIGFIIAIYFLMSKKNLKNTSRRLRSALMSEQKLNAQNQFWNKCNEIFIQYIGCSLLDACIIGFANAIFMMIFGMSNITLISVIVGVTNLLPTFGPLIGGAVGAVLLLLTKPVHALAFLIFTVILQTMDGYVIKPKLFSNSLGLSPVVTLVSIILGGKMFGILGILLAIPVVAVMAMLYSEKFLPWIRERRREAEASGGQKETLPEEPQEQQENAEKETIPAVT